MDKNMVLSDPRFKGIASFDKKIWLSSPVRNFAMSRKR